MSSLVISGDTSGQVTISAPAVAGSNTLTLQAATATNSVNTLSTAVASTSGTSITFSSIPSWVKRITMMLKGVGTSSTSYKLIQLGSGSPTITGYAASGTAIVGSVVGGAGYTTGFGIADATAASRLSGSYVFTLENASTNTWCCNGTSANASTTMLFSAGNVSLAGTLDRIIFTTVNGTDTMAAGEINILYEG